MIKNRFCKDCKLYSSQIQHCVYGFSGFKLDSPTECMSFEEKVGMSKYDIPCHDCSHNKMTIMAPFKAYCTYGQKMFKTRGAKQCPKYTQSNYQKPNNAILLPDKSKDKQEKPKMKILYNEEEYSWMVD